MDFSKQNSLGGGKAYGGLCKPGQYFAFQHSKQAGIRQRWRPEAGESGTGAQASGQGRLWGESQHQTFPIRARRLQTRKPNLCWEGREGSNRLKGAWKRVTAEGYGWLCFSLSEMALWETLSCYRFPELPPRCPQQGPCSRRLAHCLLSPTRLRCH